MSLTDPIADMLTRIRNALARSHEMADMPSSKMKVEIARVLKKEGYIRDYRVMRDKHHSILKIILKYSAENKGTITGIKRASRPGCRVYVGKEDVPMILNGLGLAIMSTSKGILSDAEAREKKVGGEVICEIW